MDSYYQSLITEIQKLIAREEYQEAYELIHQEITLPYVPKDYLKILEDYQDQCLPYLKKLEKKIDIDKILDLMQGTNAEKELVVPLLRLLNLRQYTQEVQELLNADLSDMCKGEVIEQLMEQKVDTPFTIEKEGLEITFVPSVILGEDADLTLHEVLKLFDRWFSNDEPTLINFCEALLHQEILLRRPFDLSEEEALPIAKSIVRLVYQAMMRTDEFEHFVQKNQLDKVQDEILFIEEKENSDGNKMDIE